MHLFYFSLFFRLQPGLSKDDINNEASKSPGEEKGPDIIPGNQNSINIKHFIKSTINNPLKTLHFYNGTHQSF